MGKQLVGREGERDRVNRKVAVGSFFIMYWYLNQQVQQN
jgi:hypothetical protein